MSSPLVVAGALADGVVPCGPDAARQAAPVAARQATRPAGGDGDPRHGAALCRVAISPRSPRHIEVRP